MYIPILHLGAALNQKVNLFRFSWLGLWDCNNWNNRCVLRSLHKGSPNQKPYQGNTAAQWANRWLLKYKELCRHMQPDGLMTWTIVQTGVGCAWRFKPESSLSITHGLLSLTSCLWMINYWGRREIPYLPPASIIACWVRCITDSCRPLKWYLNLLYIIVTYLTYMLLFHLQSSLVHTEMLI